jgi:hypothetical protein
MKSALVDFRVSVLIWILGKQACRVWIIHLAQGMDCWWAFVSIVMNILAVLDMGSFLTSGA